MYTTRKDFLKQTGFALAGSFLPYSKIFGNLFQASAVDTSHPKDCVDLRGYLFTESKIRHDNAGDIFTYCKNVTDHDTNDPLKDVFYKGDKGSCTTADVNDCRWSDAHDKKWLDEMVPETTLKYKVSYPKSANQTANGHDYQNVRLPCIILFHAGGFKECTPYDDDFMETLLKEFALKGFIAISVSYRTGRLSDSSRTSAHEQLATYRGIQDARGAIRTIMSRHSGSEAFNYGNFKIDKNQVFIGGASAGAAICMNVGYLRTQTMVNDTFPVDATSQLTIEEALGPIDADYYDSNPMDALPVIRGILSCWGALRMPKSNDSGEPVFFLPDGNVVTNSQNPPVIAFHGKEDRTNDYDDDDYQNFINSTTTSRRKENFCLLEAKNFIIKQPVLDPPEAFVKKGSGLNIYNILKDSRIDRFTLLYTDCDCGHGLDDMKIPYLSDYSSGFTDDLNVTKYIASRMAVFCQIIMNYSSSSRVHPPANYTSGTIVSRSFFVDCKDDRHCVLDENGNKTYPEANNCNLNNLDTDCNPPNL